MVRGKNKHKERHHGSSSKLQEDPILVALLAKPNHNSNGGLAGTSPTISYRHVEIDRRSIVVMFNNEPTEEAQSNSEVLEDMNASPEQISEGDTSGCHGPEGGSTKRHPKDVSQTLGEEDSFSSLGVRQNAQLKSTIA
ncbi:hypothetical protein Acr_00g0056830 [Actinidia rufa]|uniref:Uncharacterized protein n=1 Tax=Actinidia rufa TaxID=165716 RepID=A0A7J0DPD4_9ERIC|nr:hypothetical protein Acr_00g0056830 [Actinidia rufa]